MRIFSISPNYSDRWNFSHELFRKALYEGHDVTHCGPGHSISLSPNIAYVIRDHNPDLVFVHHSKHIKQFNLSAVETPKVLFQIDYFPEREPWRTVYIDTQKFMIVVFPTYPQMETYQRCRYSKGSPIPYYLPFGVDTDVFRNIHLERSFTASAIFSINNSEYPQREQIIHLLKKIPNTFVKGIYQAKEALSKEDYITTLNRSRSGIAPLDKYKSAGLRIFEIPACRAALISNHGPDFDRLGFIDGFNYIKFESYKELTRRLQDSDLDYVAAQGESLIHNHHTNKHRALQFWSDIKKFL